MKPLYTQEEFNSTKSTDKLPCECYACQKTFYKNKNEITYALKHPDRKLIMYCSLNCSNFFYIKKEKVLCLNCNIQFEKTQSQIKKSKTGKHFCSHSCHAIYINKNKIHGNRRSKLEMWLEEQLTNLYPNLEIHYNQKSVIKSELDIYIPKLNLAFELNGIFHYEPIFGVDKFTQIKDNDKNKFQLCIENKIDLCIIDTSAQKYVKPSTSQKYLDIIINIINERLTF